MLNAAGLLSEADGEELTELECLEHILVTAKAQAVERSKREN